MIACIHCTVAVFLYRGRVVDHLRFLDSEFLVTIVPVFIAFVAYCMSFWFSRIFQAYIGTRIIAMLGIASLAAMLSFLLFMLITFNLYGT